MSAPSPTVVLVHGAFADSSSWNDVIADRRTVAAVAQEAGATDR
jgi:hypothetical protein